MLVLVLVLLLLLLLYDSIVYEPYLHRRQFLAGSGAATVLYRSPAAVFQHLPQDVVQVARDSGERVVRPAEHL